jgi:hypothetical protein
VRGVDLKLPEFSATVADEFLQLDLRQEDNCRRVLARGSAAVDEVYNLAAGRHVVGHRRGITPYDDHWGCSTTLSANPPFCSTTGRVLVIGSAVAFSAVSPPLTPSPSTIIGATPTPSTPSSISAADSLLTGPS